MTLKSKGFTLIELLIVIIIIGILAGMMMLSVGSATDKAKATEIVSNLRTLKSAIAMYEMDNGQIVIGDEPVLASFDQYLDRSLDDKYYVENNSSGDFYIGYYDENLSK